MTFYALSFGNVVVGGVVGDLDWQGRNSIQRASSTQHHFRSLT